MNLIGLRTGRGRLWGALALLSLAVLGVSTMTWIALQRADTRLQDLHQETLNKVAQALDLSKRSSDLATSAPYLLNQSSNFAIEQEGGKLLVVLDRVRADWPQTSSNEENEDGEPVGTILESMATGVQDLMSASSHLDAFQADIRSRTSALGRLRNTVSKEIENAKSGDKTRLVWWSLQSMNADALNAAYAGNLIGVGEEQRHYINQINLLNETRLNEEQQKFLTHLERNVWGVKGVFELRRQELSSNLRAQNALFRIRYDANRINNVASNYAEQAEKFLAKERDASSHTLRLTRITVGVISALSLLLALVAAIYVSRYVTFNISRVSSAMVRLANGDRESELPRRLGSKDEIGDLFRSFRSFRANALRLDRSNRQLDQRNALFEKVFTNISDGIAITDPVGRVTASNPAFARILRLPADAPELDNFASWLNISQFADAAQQNNLTPSHRGFCELISNEGQVIEIRASKLPDDGRVWLLADVTERRKVSDRLQQIDRIEALGKVAGNTAHDFANILSSIRTHAHLLEKEEKLKAKSSLEAISSAVDYGSSLTDRLLAFARKQSLAPERVDLNALISGMTDLVEISLKTGVELDVQLPKAPLHVIVDPGQLESALFNLLLNANNAIKDNGLIKVSLEAAGQDQAKICVKDNGQGMTNAILTRAIEPFFTTRADIGGTGLGLSIVYGFIRQTGGNMTIKSTKGNGTLVEILLSLADVDISEIIPSGNKTCLLVEDDTKTRNAVKALLKHQGFHVTTCVDGADAQSALQQNQFDLLLSDYDLGGKINGLNVIDFARQIAPTTKTLIMSGKSLGEETVLEPTGFIEKPVTRDKLIEILC